MLRLLLAGSKLKFLALLCSMPFSYVSHPIIYFLCLLTLLGYSVVYSLYHNKFCDLKYFIVHENGGVTWCFWLPPSDCRENTWGILSVPSMTNHLSLF
jgi:hypothetical protein